MPQAFDQLLDIVEETFKCENNSKLLSGNHELDRFSGNSLKLLKAACARFDEHISQHSEISIQDKRFEIVASMVSDIHSRFKDLMQVITERTG